MSITGLDSRRPPLSLCAPGRVHSTEGDGDARHRRAALLEGAAPDLARVLLPPASTHPPIPIPIELGSRVQKVMKYSVASSQDVRAVFVACSDIFQQ